MKKEIEQVFEKISQAFAESDIEKALSYFSDYDHMTKISNGLVSIGKKQLREYWQKRIGGHTVKVTLENLAIHQIDDKHAWATADEFITIDGQTQKAIVSNLLVLSEDGWKILLDHTTYLQSN